MKYFLLSLYISICYSAGYSQITQTKAGPVINEYGQVFTVNDADLLLDKDQKYKVIFDVYTDDKKPSNINPLINTVARFMNMHGQNGVPEQNMDLVIVLHGAATKDALSDTAFNKSYKRNNPNSGLMAALKNKNVKIYVCGQSLLSKGYNNEDVSEDVQVSLSALTALVKYQTDGYQLINFN
jgi:intracellular sulfur oxidation DsrE/DsrF family protein